MVVDYWIIRRGNLHVPSLYVKAEGTPYSYFHGWNLRAVAAWVAGVAFTVHGIAGALDPDSVNSASKKIYKLGFLLSFLMGSAVYYASCLIWPPSIYPSYVNTQSDDFVRFEAMAPLEGFFPGESVDSIRGVLSGVVDNYNDVSTPTRLEKEEMGRESTREACGV